eukprot:7553032-Ditylum_brightwellii.AAC.1
MSLANPGKMTYHLERQHHDNKDRYAVRKSLNEWYNNDVVRIKLAEIPRKEYKLLVAKRRRRKKCRSMIRRMKKGDQGKIGMEMMMMTENIE